MSEKRKGYITWDEYFMGVAKLSAMRSKDPSTQVGACIVSEDNKILSMGTTDFQRDAPVMPFRGRERASLWTPSICMLPIVS